jgi:GAF domain
VLVDDLRQEPRFLRRELALASGYEALLCMPLKAQTKAVGTLQLYASAEPHLSRDNLPLVQATAEQLAVAIANAHLHQTAKASEAEYRCLVENIPKPIFRLDLEGRSAAKRCSPYSATNLPPSQAHCWPAVINTGRNRLSARDVPPYPAAWAIHQSSHRGF